MKTCILRLSSFFHSLCGLAWLGGLPLALWACVAHPLAQPRPEPVQETDAQITIVPVRQLDLLFMVDNSPSMKPKQDKMRAQFPKLIEALRDPYDNSLPDLRIAILDSDLGAGQSTQCADSANYGDRGRFQMRDAAGCGANGDARWLEYTKGRAVNFTGDLSQVFGCLAGNVGVAGCGFEHQLAALTWAFYLDENQSQRAFLRRDAYLGIVILTDEDDCSAPPDTHMFDRREGTEAWSLRCATRGHVCDGAALSFPTTSALSLPYASCRARTDATCDSGQVDTSSATVCNPLLDVAGLAAAVKQLKGGGEEADEKILVAGIYGRPRQGDTSPATYKIDRIPDPTPTMTGEVYDYWPVCFDPAFPPAGSGWDQTAAEHGAAGGLRIDAFLGEFPERSRLAYSICESDFGPAMAGIGKALTIKMGGLCVPFKLVDISDEPGLQADCRVTYRIPRATTDAQGNTSVLFEEKPDGLPACDAKRTPDCWEVKRGDEHGSAEEQDTARRCPAKDGAQSQMVDVVRAADLPLGTKIVMQCLTCVDQLPGTEPSPGCDY
jgi:hypothetical protein